jgi:hypothetical protein
MALGAASRVDIRLSGRPAREHPWLANGYLIFIVATAAVFALAQVGA